MKVRDRLSLQFTIISAVLLLAVLSGVYFLTLRHKENDFQARLVDRAITNAELFLAQDNLSEEKFREVQKKFPLNLPGEIVRIYNDHNESVFIKDSSFQWPVAVINQVRTQKFVYYEQDLRQIVGIYYVDNSGNFTVLVSAKDIYGAQQMHQLFLVLLSIFTLSVFIHFFAGRLFARLALSPIIKVINDVKYIRSSSLDKRLVTKGGKDEINDLVNTFNNLLEHLEQSFEAQSSFVAHASHELRTPVTAVIGEIEVTLSQERTMEEYKRVLRDALTESVRLSELINNLFDLAQANVGFAEFQELRLDELIWLVKDEWTNKLPDSKVELIYDLPEDQKKYTIYGNIYLLYIALGNILKNAIKFSDNKLVTCRLHVKNDMPVISICDNGIGIKKEDIQNIFQPFYRGSNTAGYSGYGIGLSLAEKILKLHNVRISVTSDLNQGAKFFLLFSR